MKHATAGALDQLEPLLETLRALPGLVEKSRGVFYRKSKAFLHFHEDPKGLFADLRNADGSDFDRFEVTAEGGREALILAALDKPGIRQLDPEVQHDLLFSQTASARYVTGMGVTDDKGRRIIVHASKITYVEIGVADVRRVGFGIAAVPAGA